MMPAQRSAVLHSCSSSVASRPIRSPSIIPPCEPHAEVPGYNCGWGASMPGVRWTMKPPGGSAMVRFASRLFAVSRAWPGGLGLAPIVQSVSPRRGSLTGPFSSGRPGRGHVLDGLRADQDVKERDGRNGPGDQEGPAVSEEEDDSRVDLEVGLGEGAGTGQHRTCDGDEDQEHREGSGDGLPHEAARASEGGPSCRRHAAARPGYSGPRGGPRKGRRNGISALSVPNLDHGPIGEPFEFGQDLIESLGPWRPVRREHDRPRDFDRDPWTPGALIDLSGRGRPRPRVEDGELARR